MVLHFFSLINSIEQQLKLQRGVKKTNQKKMSGPQCCSNPPSLNPSGGGGHVNKVGGVDSYFSGSSHSKLALLMLSDVFGISSPSSSSSSLPFLSHFLFAFILFKFFFFLKRTCFFFSFCIANHKVGIFILCMCGKKFGKGNLVSNIVFAFRFEQQRE